MRPLVTARPAALARSAQVAAAPARTPGTLRQLYQLLVANGRWWLVPLLLVLGVTGVLLALVTAIEYVAPFVYTIF